MRVLYSGWHEGVSYLDNDQNSIADTELTHVSVHA